MSALLFALALAVQAPAGAPADAPAPVRDGHPVGAPRGDYQFVAWCYGSLRGYLELHDQVMPEVTRIETTWRRPGSNLADDLRVYADQQREGQKNLKQFQRAMTAAEKASMRPINAEGAEAIKRGRAVWAGAPAVSKARLAQEWMSWTLPAKCGTTAAELEKRAVLAGQAFQVNIETLPEPSQAAPEAPPEAPAPVETSTAPQSVDEALGQAPEAPAGPAVSLSDAAAALPPEEAARR